MAPAWRKASGATSLAAPCAGVQNHVQAVQTVRQSGQQMGDVSGRAVLERAHPADIGAGGPVPGLVQACLDGILELVGQLVAAAREELDAVVRHRVVGGREHGAHVSASVSDEERDGRSRQYPCVQDIDPGGGQPRDGRRRQELSGSPGVAADDRRRSMMVEGTDLSKHVGRRHRKIKNELSGHMLVRKPANAIGAKESSSHRSVSLSVHSTFGAFKSAGPRPAYDFAAERHLSEKYAEKPMDTAAAASKLGRSRVFKAATGG